MIVNPTFGGDFEVFLLTLNNEYFPSCGLLGGSKEKPRSIGQGFFIQEDNVLAEVNIPVSTHAKDFVTHVKTAVHKISMELPPSLLISHESAVDFPKVYIKSILKAQEFGCEPDYCAWTMEQNPRPTATNPFLRTAAAHVHIGWDNPQPDDQLAMIKWADVFVTLPSVIESTDRKRRELYGKAGCFRPKEYGVEHRTLDNYWLFDQRFSTAVRMRYDWAIKAVNAKLKIDEKDIPNIINAINNYDVPVAKSLNRKYRDIIESI